MTKLFVGGLSYSLSSQDLQAMFATYGQVQSAQVIIDRTTNQSKGFGFVEMANDSEAEAAITGLNDTEVEGRRVSVSVARPREERPQGGGFNRDRNFGGGGGGNRSNGAFGRDNRGGGNRGGGSRY